eukprot:1836439-Lingulodinium_polyedra.AAC.1
MEVDTEARGGRGAHASPQPQPPARAGADDATPGVAAGGPLAPSNAGSRNALRPPGTGQLDIRRWCGGGDAG